MTMRAPALQLGQQQVGDDEIGHVVEGEGHLQPVCGFLPLVEQGAGIVDQHVDLRLARQFAAPPASFPKAATDRPCARHGRRRDWPCAACAMVSSARALSRAVKTMRAPCSARRMAATSPMPEVAPVMTTVLPCMSHSSSSPGLMRAIHDGLNRSAFPQDRANPGFCARIRFSLPGAGIFLDPCSRDEWRPPRSEKSRNRPAA